MSRGRPRERRIIIVDGRYQVEVPVAPGSRQRLRRTFDALEDAQAWCDAAHDALDAGLQVPNPTSSLSTGARTPAPGTTFEEVAWAWFAERYLQARTARAARRRTVDGIIRNHILPFAHEHGYLTGSQVERDAYKALLVALAGRTVSPATSASAREVSLAGAAKEAGVSTSTVKRRIADGSVPSRRDERGRRLVQVDRLIEVVGSPAPRRGPRTTQGYAQDVLADIRWILDSILEYGVETAGWALQFRLDRVVTPRTARPCIPRGQLTFEDCVELARHLHPVHQVTLWLIRCLGLRIGEAFGLTLADVLPQGDRALIRVRRQGGRTFDDDEVGGPTAPTQKKLKTINSVRALVAPGPLASFLTTVITVFHTDELGEVLADARLIPRLATDDESGQQAFRDALRAAGRAAGIDLGTDDDETDALLLPSPKDGRAAVLTDLAWSRVDDLIRRRFGGHAAGSAVAERHYVLDHPEFTPLVEAAEELERLLAQAAPGGLIIPTPRSCTTGNQPALRARKERIEPALLDAGWWTTDADAEGRALVTPEQAASILGISARGVRKLARAGRIRGVDPTGRHLYRVEAILAHADASRASRRLTDVCVEAGADYHRVWQWVRAHGHQVIQEGPGRPVFVPAATEAGIREWLQSTAALRERAVPVSEAAERLRVSAPVIDALIAAGRLEVDPVRDGGVRHITRASIAACADTIDGVGLGTLHPALRSAR